MFRILVLSIFHATLEFIKLENKGLEVCKFGSNEATCSLPRDWNQLGHVAVQVKAIPFNKRNNGRTISVSKYIDK